MRSSTTTLRPARANGAASAQPAKRAPTTTTSDFSTSLILRSPSKTRLNGADPRTPPPYL